MAFKERRREDRFDVDLDCAIGVCEERMKVHNISLHGISIKGDAILSNDQPIDIVVTGNNGEKITLRAVVRNMVKLEGVYRYGCEIIANPASWLHLVYDYQVKCR